MRWANAINQRRRRPEDLLERSKKTLDPRREKGQRPNGQSTLVLRIKCKAFYHFLRKRRQFITLYSNKFYSTIKFAWFLKIGDYSYTHIHIQTSCIWMNQWILSHFLVRSLSLYRPSFLSNDRVKWRRIEGQRTDRRPRDRLDTGRGSTWTDLIYAL